MGIIGCGLWLIHKKDSSVLEQKKKGGQTPIHPTLEAYFSTSNGFQKNNSVCWWRYHYNSTSSRGRSRRSVTVGQVKSYYSCYVSFGVVGSLLLLSTQKIVQCVWKYGFGTIFLFQQQQQQTIVGEFI
jgi:hypothetical protein